MATIIAARLRSMNGYGSCRTLNVECPQGKTIIVLDVMRWGERSVRSFMRPIKRSRAMTDYACAIIVSRACACTILLHLGDPTLNGY